MSTQTTCINALRGFCRGFGLTLPPGARTGIEATSRTLADPNSAIPTLIRGLMKLLVEEVLILETPHCPVGTEIVRTGPALSRLHPPADHPRQRAVDCHGAGRRHQRGGRLLQGRPSLCQVVRVDTPGIFFWRWS